MTSADMKAALAALGIKARVRDFGRNFRVAPVSGEWGSKSAVVDALNSMNSSHGVTNWAGAGFALKSFNMQEIFVYKPGAVRA